MGGAARQRSLTVLFPKVLQLQGLFSFALDVLDCGVAAECAASSFGLEANVLVLHEVHEEFEEIFFRLNVRFLMHEN